MQSLSNKSKSSALFSTGTAGLGINAIPPATASHLSDTIQGSNWIGTFGNAGYILPNTASGSILSSTFQVIPSWLEILSTSMISAADTFSNNRPNRPDGIATNDFWSDIGFVGRNFIFNIPYSVGPKKISFYITNITASGSTTSIAISNASAPQNGLITPIRQYDQGGGGGISTAGGLVTQYEVSGPIQIDFFTFSFFGFISAIFFDN